MAVAVLMPALAMARETGRLVRWLKREGERVTQGEPLMEVETDKAVVEVESPGAGILSGVRVREGEEVPVGTVCAYLLAPTARPGTGPPDAPEDAIPAPAAPAPARGGPACFVLFRDVHASQLIVARARQPAAVTAADLVLRLVALTLARHLPLNAGRAEVDVAVALAGEQGLVAPVIRRADRLPAAALAARRAELTRRLEAGRLRARDLVGASFTVSDLGPFGVDALLPVVVEGQAATLGTGRVADRVVPVEGRPLVRPMLSLALTCDHRMVDGAAAARFLADLAAALEEPAQVL